MNNDILKKIQNDETISSLICNAQKNINIASLELANKVDVMIIIGGKNSSNSLELFKNINTLQLPHNKV